MQQLSKHGYEFQIKNALIGFVLKKKLLVQPGAILIGNLIEVDADNVNANQIDLGVHIYYIGCTMAQIDISPSPTPLKGGWRGKGGRDQMTSHI